MTQWLVSQWLVSQWLVSQWLVSQWLVSQWLVSQWLVSQWRMKLGHPSHPRRRRPTSTNLEQRQGTSFEFLLFSNHLINSRSVQLIFVKPVLGFPRVTLPKRM